MRSYIFNKKGEIEKSEELRDIKANAVLVYATCDSEYKDVIKKIKQIFKNADVFGATSFQGVFSSSGFIDGGAFLVFEENDNIHVSAQITSTNLYSAKENSIKISEKIKDTLKAEPDCILMHGVPGYEERIIEGINTVFMDKVPIYGGSAGDNDLTGKWKIFKNEEELSEGVLLVGFKSSNKIYGSFLAGYIPTKYRGKITKSEGRIIHEIDRKPAALVYNEWTKGVISEFLDKGDIVLAQTTLHPVGRVVGTVVGVPIYLLSHPHQVIKDTKSLSFFTEFEEGDEIILMHGTERALIERTSQVASRALMPEKEVTLKGGILIYCAGCVGAVMEKKDEIVKEFEKVVGKIPFIGAATFGEQGFFKVEKNRNRHGNLMCNTILFS